MNVLIVNTVVLNTGDAAILQSLLHTLRDGFGPDVHAIVLDSHPAAARTRYPAIDFRPSAYTAVARGAPPPGAGLTQRAFLRLVRNLRIARFRIGMKLWRLGGHAVALFLLGRRGRMVVDEYLGADLIVSTGGTYLVENYALGPKLFDLALAIDLDRPLVLFTQSLGPFRQSRHRAQVRRVATGARLVLLRDTASLNHLQEIGVADSRLAVAADAAFGLPKHFGGLSQIRRPQSKPGLRVAISVRSWSWFRHITVRDGMARFAAVISDVAGRLVNERNAQITFVSTCQGAPEYHADDSITAATIVETLPLEVRPHVIVDHAFHTPEALAAMLQGFDLVIATRMHFAILALMAGVVTVAVAYEFKTNELYAAMDLKRLVEDIETIESASLMDKINWALGNRDELERTIAAAVSRQRERAGQTAGWLRAALMPGS